MRTMFFKLFFWFWLALTLSGLFFFLLAISMRTGPIHAKFEQHFAAERNRIVIQALTLYGRASAIVFERSGRATPMNFVDPQGSPGMKAFLFTANGTPLTGEIPPFLKVAVALLIERNADEIIVTRELTAAAVRIISPRGVPYIAAALVVNPPPPPKQKPLESLLFPPDFWYRFVISLIIGGLVCYGLAWHLTAPIRRLRLAAQGLAAGDLSTRVEVRGNISGDEVIDLSRDFNRMAERIERLVTAQQQLTRDISHELRSPLARLNVALGLARRNAAPETATALDRIEQEADRLNALIGELLTLSLLESDSGTFDKETFDLSELVEEVVRDADFEAAGSDRRVEFSKDSPVSIVGNREMLRRALENVVRNGIRYTDEGTAVEVGLEHTSQGQAVINVRDHGPGVPEAAVTEIFRPFYRLEEARDRNTGGTGIGLAITEQTVRLHGGTVAARNMTDGGLEVTIALPAATKG